MTAENNDELRVTHSCPKCGLSEDIFDYMVKKAKEIGVLSQDFETVSNRLLTTPLVSRAKARLLAHFNSQTTAPILIEKYVTCALCGTYYCAGAHIQEGIVGATAMEQPPSPPNPPNKAG